MGRPLWLVNASESRKIKHTHACGWEIHILPQHTLPPFISPIGGAIDLPIVAINLRKFASSEIMNVIQRYVPEAVGFQVLMSGWVIILFDKRKSMKAYWKRTNKGSFPRNITDIGCLRPGYGILSCKTTTGNARSGCSIGSRPD